MITIRSDNRVLISSNKYAYLTQNYASGVGTVNITNTEPFSADDFAIFGEWGHSNSEIFRIGSVAANGDITLQDTAGTPTTTVHPHPESTKVQFIPYNQVRFYWTAALGTIADETPTFDSLTPLTGYTDLDPTSFYTSYTDTTNTSGFGWFEYLNSVTLIASQESNPVPYAGFPENTVLSVFNDFESLLNVNELKLISMSDKFAWFNEAMSTIKNRLNLSNVEYTVSSTQTISIVSGTSEYQLPSDFADLIEITNDSDDTPIDFIPVSQILSYSSIGNTTTKYYLRGRYIGFVPTPTSSGTYNYRYRAKATKATSLSTYLDLPDNMFYAIKDWMLYRAKSKFSDPSATSYFASFKSAMDGYIESSVKRNANLDSWDIASEANN